MVSNRNVAEETWWLELACDPIAAASEPGQFLMIGFGTPNTSAPFLPRPFSVGRASPDGRVGLLVRAFGEGTRRLSRLGPGDEVLLLGPLGRGFRLDPAAAGDGRDGGGREEDGRGGDEGAPRPALCVAGGVGLAPFVFLADRERGRGREVRLLYGERSGSRVFEPSLLEELTGGPVEVWTEDGARGRRGRVTEGVDLAADPHLLGCGPPAMLAALAALAVDRGARLQVSVEEHMGCGVGTCQGCVVRGADGRWIKSCVEGPVFAASELAWDA